MEGIKFDLIQFIDLDGDADLDVINAKEATDGKGLDVVWYENPTRCNNHPEWRRSKCEAFRHQSAKLGIAPK